MSKIPDFLIGKGTHKLISQRRYAKCLSLCNRLRADIIVFVLILLQLLFVRAYVYLKGQT